LNDSQAVERVAGAHELLDGPLHDEAALAGNLRDLRRVNGLLGGVTLSLRAIASFAAADDRRALRVLDVGTGAADIPIAVRRRWPRGIPAPEFVATDSRPEILAAARRVSPALDDEPGIDLVVADGRALPWPDGAFDVAHVSMVLHHLDPVDAVRLLRELGRVAARGIVLNDLDRQWVYWLGAWLLTRTATRNGLTRNDGPLSVRRGYTVREAGDLLRVAGLRPMSVRRAFFGHRYAISAVQA
jgi:SAM-dependent methyltransferase